MYVTKEWNVNNQRFVGGSLAGVGTSIGALDFGVCFDVANGPRHTLKFNHFCITHAHSDHAGGLAYVLAQKAMVDQKPPKFYVPAEIKDGLERIISEWERLEDCRLPVDLVPMTPGGAVAIAEDLKVVPFRTVHRVPSLGYTVYARKKKMRKELLGKTAQEIIQLRAQGVAVEEYIDFPEISFTGDTQIEVLEKHPEILRSRLLFFEVSFYDEKRPVAYAKKWGHTHFDEILPYVREFKGEKLVLIHPSARYRGKDLRQLINNRAGAEAEKIFLAPSLFSARE